MTSGLHHKHYQNTSNVLVNHRIQIKNLITENCYDIPSNELCLYYYIYIYTIFSSSDTTMKQSDVQWICSKSSSTKPI